MKILKSNVTKIILASIIFPVVMILISLFVHNKNSTSVWQMLSDLLVFLVAFFLNNRYFKQKVSWFNPRDLGQQLYTAFPAIIIIAVLDSPMLQVPDFKVKLEVIVLCLFVGLAEEYIFRGILIDLFLKLFRNNVLGAVIGSSVMFGMIHLMNLRALPIGYVSAQVLFAIAIGILFGTIYVKTRNLSNVILLHALRDMFPMFSNKMVSEMSMTKFSIATIYVMLVFLVITLIVAYVQLNRFEVKAD